MLFGDFWIYHTKLFIFLSMFFFSIVFLSFFHSFNGTWMNIPSKENYPSMMLSKLIFKTTILHNCWMIREKLWKNFRLYFLFDDYLFVCGLITHKLLLIRCRCNSGRGNKKENFFIIRHDTRRSRDGSRRRFELFAICMSESFHASCPFSWHHNLLKTIIEGNKKRKFHTLVQFKYCFSIINTLITSSSMECWFALHLAMQSKLSMEMEESK